MALGSNGEIRKVGQPNLRVILHWLGSTDPPLTGYSIGQDFEVDLLKRMGFWLQSSLDGKGS